MNATGIAIKPVLLHLHSDVKVNRAGDFDEERPKIVSHSHRQGMSKDMETGITRQKPSFLKYTVSPLTPISTSGTPRKKELEQGGE